MLKKFKLFCFGFGQVAQYFIKNLNRNNLDFEFISTNTNKTKLKKFNNLEHKSYYFVDNEFDEDLLNDLNSSDKVLISIPPKNKIDIVLKLFDKHFKKNRFQWVTYLSATSVYGDKKGQWVDENTKTEPTSERGIARLNAEKQWLRHFKDFGLPVQIFRLSGIYSIENNVINKLKTGRIQIVKRDNHFFSRIHIEDIAQILTLSLKKFAPGQIFNISDNYPCSYQEIVEYACKLLKTDVPKKIKFDEINEEMLKNFYRNSKKVSNQKMKNFFEYNLQYPTYKEGLKMIRNHKV